jgi:hypothetical protein
VPLRLAAALLLLTAGGLAIGGSFGKLAAEYERAGDATLVLTYTSWRIIQGGTYRNAIYFHAPHFGIPLVSAGVLTIATGVALALGRGRPRAVAGPAALAAAGLLVGTVWTVGIVMSANVHAVTATANVQLTWTTGIGLWLVLASGVAGLAGGICTLLVGIRPEPGPTAPGAPSRPVPRVPFVPEPARRLDGLPGTPLGPAALPVFQPPTPPTAEPTEPT